MVVVVAGIVLEVGAVVVAVLWVIMGDAVEIVVRLGVGVVGMVVVVKKVVLPYSVKYTIPNRLGSLFLNKDYH